MSRFKGILRDYQGNPKGKFVGYYGVTTNNMEKFTALAKGSTVRSEDAGVRYTSNKRLSTGDSGFQMVD